MGSPRAAGNGAGIAQHISSALQRHLVGHSVELVSSTTHPLVFSASEHAVMPALMADASQYPSVPIREWSELVSTCTAVVVVSPQYNWGYPGPLKNTLDHLYKEWHGKPALIVTYGGHGGSSCAEQLQVVMTGGLKMRVAPQGVQITLPKTHIIGSERLTSGSELLLSYADAIDAAISELQKLIGA